MNSSDSPRWRIPKLNKEDIVIGGVASGIARQISLDPIFVRLSFVILFAAGGWGALLYVIFWGLLAWSSYANPEEIEPKPNQTSAVEKGLGLALVVLGLLVGTQELDGVNPSYLWPTAVVASGVVIAARRIKPLSNAANNSRLFHLLAGICVATVGVVMLVLTISFRDNRQLLFAVAIAGFAAFALVTAPWWRNFIRDLDTERKAKAIADERADIAAHLHDSVLQTLSLIQKENDPNQIAILARQQERELRNWLDPNRKSRTGGSIRGRLDEIATELEHLHGTKIEIVAVGDCVVTEEIETLLAATREALNNAARHSRSETVDLYVETFKEKIQVFVRDKGKGFDTEEVPSDRQGISYSIIGRMERVGGEANILTEEGKGTEVELILPTGQPLEKPET